MTDKVRVKTRRFGEVEIDEDTIFHFPHGLLGMEALHRWCLLHHEEVTHLDWLQAVDDPELSLLLVNPDDLFSDFDVTVESDDIAPLNLAEEKAYSGTPPVVMRVVMRPDEEGHFVVNVRAPILFNLDNRRGMQLALEKDRLPAHYRGPIALSVGTEEPVSV